MNGIDRFAGFRFNHGVPFGENVFEVVLSGLGHVIRCRNHFCRRYFCGLPIRSVDLFVRQFITKRFLGRRICRRGFGHWRLCHRRFGRDFLGRGFLVAEIGHERVRTVLCRKIDGKILVRNRQLFLEGLVQVFLGQIDIELHVRSIFDGCLQRRAEILIEHLIRGEVLVGRERIEWRLVGEAGNRGGSFGLIQVSVRIFEDRRIRGEFTLCRAGTLRTGRRGAHIGFRPQADIDIGRLELAQQFGFEVDFARLAGGGSRSGLAVRPRAGWPVISDNPRKLRKRIVVIDHASGVAGVVVILISHVNSHTRHWRCCQSNVGKWWRQRISSGASVPVICKPDFNTQATA